MTFPKTIRPIFLLLVCLNTYSTPEIWPQAFSKSNLLWLTAGATTALVIGKISYNLYQTYVAPHEQFIENCRTFYGTLHKDIQACHNAHYNNAQMSDWELKEIIIQKYADPYPFITYHALLTKNSWMLKKHVTNLDKQLKQITLHKRQITTGHATESTAHVEELLMQLEIKGSFLQNYITKTITLVTILKNRVKLFKEYSEDCYNWSQQEKTLSNASSRNIT